MRPWTRQLVSAEGSISAKRGSWWSRPGSGWHRGGPDDLRRLVEHAQADLGLVERLDDARSLGNARSLGATLETGKLDPSEAEPLYASAFAEAELGRAGEDVEAVASRVRDSAVRAEPVAALDDWASTTPDLRRRDWLLAVARAADGDPARNRLR
jgi:hypothetical protein